jgi:hypothetical protein
VTLLVPECFEAAALRGHRAKVTGFHSSRGTGYGRWDQDPWRGSGRGRLLARDTNTEDNPLGGPGSCAVLFSECVRRPAQKKREKKLSNIADVFSYPCFWWFVTATIQGRIKPGSLRLCFFSCYKLADCILLRQLRTGSP